jgi:cholesterol transport system auxiliary component
MTPRLLVPALASLLLGACSILPQPESPTVYLLPTASPPPAAAPAPVAWSLRVDTPDAAHALDGARIVVVPQDNVVTTYRGARWTDRAPVLLRDRLLEAFRADGRVAALSSDSAELGADYELGGDLPAFQSQYEDGRPVVVVRYDARLVQGRSQRILAARRFEVREPVAGKEVPQVVAAFGRAGDALAAQVIPWTIREAAAARSSGK